MLALVYNLGVMGVGSTKAQMFEWPRPKAAHPGRGSRPEARRWADLDVTEWSYFRRCPCGPGAAGEFEGERVDLPVVSPGAVLDAVVFVSRIESTSPATTTMASIASMTIVLQWRASPTREVGGLIDPRVVSSLRTGPSVLNSVVMCSSLWFPKRPTRSQNQIVPQKKKPPHGCVSANAWPSGDR